MACPIQPRTRVALPKRSNRRAIVPALFWILLCSASAAAAAAAQEPHPPAREAKETGRIVGQVRDAETGAPVAGAFVELPALGIGTIADPRGRFTLPLEEGRHVFAVRRLGYETIEVEADVAPGDFVEFTMSADPVLMEGLTVMVDRLEQRRRAAPISVSVIRSHELATAVSGHLGDDILRRFGITTTSCPADPRRGALTALSGTRNCIWFRGRPIVPRVLIDEFPMIGGIEELNLFLPHEIHLVEVYGRGRMIRVYTTAYMERLARRPTVLFPLSF